MVHASCSCAQHASYACYYAASIHISIYLHAHVLVAYAPQDTNEFLQDDNAPTSSSSPVLVTQVSPPSSVPAPAYASVPPPGHVDIQAQPAAVPVGAQPHVSVPSAPLTPSAAHAAHMVAERARVM